MITLQEIKQNESIKALVRAANHYLELLGYTDHGPRHLSYVSRTASGAVDNSALAGWREAYSRLRAAAAASEGKLE